MLPPRSWKVLRSAQTTEVVLAVDFPATGRPEAGFNEFTALFPEHYSLWESIPPEPADAVAMSGPDWVRRWLDDLCEGEVKVRAVLGYCAGSVYGSVLAEQIGTWQDEPVLILFDPEVANPLTVSWQFHKVIDNLAGALTPAETDTAKSDGDRAREEYADLRELTAALVTIFRRVAGTAFERIGLDAVGRDEILDMFAAFMAYLAAGADLDPTAGWKRAVAISSITPTNGLNLVDPDVRADLVDREIRVDLPHADLLRDRSVAAAAAALIR